MSNYKKNNRSNDRNTKSNFRENRDGGRRKPYKRDNYEGDRRPVKTYNKKPYDRNPSAVKNSEIKGYKTSYELLISLVCTSFENTLRTMRKLGTIQDITGLKISILVDHGDEALFKKVQEEFADSRNTTVTRIDFSIGLFIHNKSFFTYLGSRYFIAMDDTVEVADYAIKKAIKFAGHKNDIAAISPKFYNKKGDVLRLCKRFNTLGTLLQKKCPKIKDKMVMMERGESGYHTVHRVDHASSRFLIIKSDIFFSVKGFTSGIGCDNNTEIDLCNKFIKKDRKVLFYPFIYAVLHKNYIIKNTSRFVELFKHFLINGFKF